MTFALFMTSGYDLLTTFSQFFFYNLLMTYSGLLQDKFMAYSWFDQKFSKSSWIFFRNIWAVFNHNLFTIFSGLVQLILLTCSQLFHNLLWIFYDLFMAYSWLLHYLLMPCSSCSWLNSTHTKKKIKIEWNKATGLLI